MANEITIEVFTNTGVNYLPTPIISIDENNDAIYIDTLQSSSPTEVIKVDENEQPIYIETSIDNNQPVYIETSPYYAPVQSVNGKIGFVTITQEDLGITGSIVYTDGFQTISGLKDFTVRPTVNTIPVLLSGEAASSIEQYVKNDEGSIIYKGQPVYVNGSNGNNILIKLARNTGESSSSKTFGLLKQDLGVNQFGYIVTEGPISQINTIDANEGDPIWLGPTGNLIYGLTNKPKAPNHLVYLGFVERSHQNQGKIFVKIQNGFEIDELHNVRIINPQNNDIIQYNSQSGLWLNTGVNLSSYATNTNLALTGSTLDIKINNLSGYIEQENILEYKAELTVGNESLFLTYPFILNSPPSSITCSFQNTIDNIIYNYAIGQITETGFYINFSDILTNSGYLLNIKIKK